MAINYVVAEFKPLYVPFDYSFSPCKKYVPPIPAPPIPAPVSPLRGTIIAIESALRLNTCTPRMVQELTFLLELDRQAPFEHLETVEDAENLLDDLRDRAPELFKKEPASYLSTE